MTEESRPRLTVAQGDAEDIPASPQELAEDIERTRQHVGEMVEALTAKLDIGAQVSQRADRLKEQLRTTSARAAQTAEEQWRTTSARAARIAEEERVPLAVAAGSVALGAALFTWAVTRR